jgi:tetraacyldisaccharide 4'-kinase
VKAPEFWWKAPPTLAARCLAPAGALFGAVTAWRMGLHGATAPCPVVCVGNFVAGGAGKTPVALALQAMLRNLGHTPAFLSRGYGGTLKGPLVVDAARHTALEAGDEPLLLAAAALTVVARDRVAGASLCHRQGASIIIMDDGLQNPSLKKAVSIAVVDAVTGIGNGLCLPAGPLRAPLARQWPHVQALVVMGQGEAGEGEAGDALASEAKARGVAVFRGAIQPDALAAQALAGKRVLAFAGIGRPAKFFATLRAIGAEIVEEHALADHALPSVLEAQTFRRHALEKNLTLVTTAKDHVRLGARADLRDLGAATAVLPVTVEFDQPDDLATFLKARLA